MPSVVAGIIALNGFLNLATGLAPIFRSAGIDDLWSSGKSRYGINVEFGQGAG